MNAKRHITVENTEHLNPLLARSEHILTAWPFLVALLLLLVNDLVLKHAYPGWVTGKLSDFAGLFIVAGLTVIIRPRRPALPLLLAAALFAWWKSPQSEWLIDFFRSSGIPMARVVDPTDLIALTANPIGAIQFRRWLSATRPEGKRAMAIFSGALVMMALMGTSRIPPMHSDLVVRPADSAGEVEADKVAAVVARVMVAHGFHPCVGCVPLRENEVIFQQGTSAYLRYVLLSEPSAIRFTLRGYGDTERIYSELKSALASEYPKMEFAVEPAAQ